MMIKYLKSRLNERSTWLLISTSLAAASALPWPWSLFFIIVGVISALVPDANMDEEK